MSFGNILSQILQDGIGGQTQTRGRLQNTAQTLDRTDGGLGGNLGQLQGALGGGSGQSGGFADMARSFLGDKQVGSLSGAQVGGIGAAAGALLGGGLGGAAKGGAMAILGTLALGALKRAQAGQAGQAQAVEPEQPVRQEEVAALTGPDAERLLLKAMIGAAKADGQIDQSEMQKIIGHMNKDDVTPEEKQFVLDQMSQPIEVQDLAAEVRGPAQAAQVYAASILAIDADTEQERRYLRDLAAALRLDDGTVRQLHDMTGAPV